MNVPARNIIKPSLRHAARIPRHVAGIAAVREQLAHFTTGRLGELSQELDPLTDIAARIAETFGLNRTWLLSGEGPVRTVAEPQGAPVYDIDITAGPVGLTRDFTSEHIVGHLALPDISPDCPVVRVSGNSMTPTINNGALLSIRPVTATGPIFWGQIYVVVLDDYRMVKYVRRHPDPAMVILHSANHDYEDMEIRRSDIRALFLVEAVINYERRC